MELNVLRAVEQEHASLLHNHRYLRNVDSYLDAGEDEDEVAKAGGESTLDETAAEQQLLRRHSMRHEMTTAEGGTVVLHRTRALTSLLIRRARASTVLR